MEVLEEGIGQHERKEARKIKREMGRATRLAEPLCVLCALLPMVGPLVVYGLAMRDLRARLTGDGSPYQQYLSKNGSCWFRRVGKELAKFIKWFMLKGE